ncbi:MAG: hypothetical protein HY776_07490 [Actinobacteria bacterium]|nr:hypothetical protein [Actinomycetota bacterium]
MTFVIIILLLISLMLPIGLMWGYWVHKKRQKVLEKIKTRKHYESIANFPVFYLSQQKFWKYWKSTEAVGVFFVNQDEVVFSGLKRNGQELEMRFTPKTGEIRWIGPQAELYAGKATVFWFEVNSNGEKHYFTSDIEAFTVTSERDTRKIFDSVGAVLPINQSPYPHKKWPIFKWLTGVIFLSFGLFFSILSLAEDVEKNPWIRHQSTILFLTGLGAVFVGLIFMTFAVKKTGPNNKTPLG